MRYLSIDYGLKRTGFAVCDSSQTICSPIEVYEGQNGLISRVKKIVAEYQIEAILFGLPLNMDGTEQAITQRAKKFANRLNGRFGVKIALQDERLTTASAKEFIFANGGYKGLDKGKIDSISAALILESWMESYYN